MPTIIAAADEVFFLSEYTPTCFREATTAVESRICGRPKVAYS